MSIIRVKKNRKNPYLVMNKTSLEDKRLSNKAKGLLSCLLSKPDNWYINYRNLSTLSTDSIFSVTSSIKELVKIGYITRTLIRKSNGQFNFYNYTVYEKPQKPKYYKNKLKPYKKNNLNSTNTTPEPKRGFPISVFPKTGSPISGNRVLLNNKDKISNIRAATALVSNTNSNPNSAAADLSNNNKKKNDTIQLLYKLGIKNHKKLFDSFSISDIFDYSTWLISSKRFMYNPTGFLITAITEKWLDIENKNSPPGLQVFFAECSICHNSFAYEEYKPKHTKCVHCRKKGK